MDKSSLATWMLLLGVVFWGATFVFIKEAVALIDVYSFIAVRFFIAAVILSLIFYKHFKNYSMEILKKGVLIGFVLGISFIFQTTGLQYTTASNAAFITGLCVVLVPIFVCFLDKKLPSLMQGVAIFLAFIGICLLTLNSFSLKFNIGDLWVLLCAVTFGIHLVMVSRLVKKIDAPMFSITQLVIVCLIALLFGFVFNAGIVIPSGFVVWKSILFCAIFATAFMYTAQAFLQRYITELKVAIIYSFEPLFAALIAFLYLGEILSFKALIGGLLVFVAMFLSEFKVEKFVEAS